MWLKHPAAKYVMKPVRLACARLSIICINTASHHSVLGAGRLLPGLAWIVFDFILDFVLISVVPQCLLYFFPSGNSPELSHAAKGVADMFR